MKIIFSLIIAIAIKSVVDVKIKEQKELREINKRDELKEMTNRVAKEIEKNRRNKVLFPVLTVIISFSFFLSIKSIL